MKIIYFGDPHITNRSPVSRLDNFGETIQKKIAWIGQYAQQEKADIVLCGGDMFNSPDASNSVIGETIKTIKNNFTSPIYLVQGNHDVYGNNPITLPRTALGVLISTGCVINTHNTERRFSYGKGDVILCGVGSIFDLEKDHTYYTLPELYKKSEDICILLVHGMLLPIKNTLFESTSIDEIKDTKADIVLCGHWHPGYCIVRKYDKYFCNPGALARVSSSYSDINLEVNIIEIDIDENGKYVVYMTKLPEDIALPADKVINIEKAHEERYNKEKLQTFITNIENTTAAEELDIYATLEKISKEEKISQDTINITREELAVAEETIKNGDTD